MQILGLTLQRFNVLTALPIPNLPTFAPYTFVPFHFSPLPVFKALAGKI